MSKSVVCPSCGSPYKLPDEAFVPEDGLVLCSACEELDEENELEARCSNCGRDDEPLNQCEVCGQWVCNSCVLSTGLLVRQCPACAGGDGLREMPF